jgi:aminoglycoside 3-N-acetyltransferase
MVDEGEVVAGTGTPATVDSLARDLAALGVEPGDVLLVHASLSRLGWVVGGARAVVLALLHTIGGDGTLVVPTHSGDISDPARWEDPPVPAPWWPTIRDHTPPFDPVLTPTRGMGAVADLVRRVPGALRSSHPTVSFAAAGPAAKRIIDDHHPADGLGERSPLGHLYELDAKVLLLGVGHGNNTSLHLGEHRADLPGKRVVTQGYPVLVAGERRWVTYDELDVDASDFEELGSAFAAAGDERRGRVGLGTGRLMRQRSLVDFAVGWLEEHRRHRT